MCITSAQSFLGRLYFGLSIHNVQLPIVKASCSNAYLLPMKQEAHSTFFLSRKSSPFFLTHALRIGVGNPQALLSLLDLLCIQRMAMLLLCEHISFSFWWSVYSMPTVSQSLGSIVFLNCHFTAAVPSPTHKVCPLSDDEMKLASSPLSA